MAIELCPLEADWGNLADWAGVLIAVISAIAATTVGLIAALGTIGVAVLAYRTSVRATQIAEEAKGISEQQQSDSVALKRGTARILGSLLRMEVGLLPVKLAVTLRGYARSVDFDTPKVMDVLGFDDALRELGQGYLPAAEGVLEQLHNLPDELGEKIATLIGMTRDIAGTSELINRRVLRMTGADDEVLIVGYVGPKADFDSLRQQLQAMLIVSLELAPEFNKFVGADAVDYVDERALVE